MFLMRIKGFGGMTKVRHPIDAPKPCSYKVLRTKHER
jgi:hypothetical protein